MIHTGIFAKPFQKKRRRAAVPKTQKPLISTARNQEILPTEIQGIPVGSTDEARVALALDTMGFQYTFHKQILGGFRIRTSLNLDFLVYTKPHPTPILVNGAYWHTGVHTDEYDTERINAHFQGRYMPVLEVWTKDTTSVDAALAFLKQHLPNV